jgi:peptidoglycan/LPS O-acetylase OafA/YrhL
MTAPATPARSTGLVVARGAATGLLLAMPAAFVNVVLADQTPKPRAGINLSFLVVLIGFMVAGWSAGREAPTEPAKHGALAAAVVFVPVEVVAVLGRLDRGDPVSLGGIIIVGLLAACVGTVGARIGGRKRTKGDVG